MHTFRGNGKLMLTAEYLALQGAQVLSVPTRFGQTLTVRHHPQPDQFQLVWRSFDVQGAVWFEAQFSKPWEGSGSESGVFERLVKLLERAFSHHTLQPGLYEVEARLEFPNNWGLGSSSSLIACLAQWSGCDALDLFYATQNGSGYDVATALRNTPMLFAKGKNPPAQSIAWQPTFINQIAFVHLQQKQNSTDEVKNYLQNSTPGPDAVAAVDAITQQMLQAKNLGQFAHLMDQHENLLSRILGRPPIKTTHFEGYSGSIKSLGAWGGDFVMVVKTPDYPSFFIERGYTTFLDWAEMVL